MNAPLFVFDETRRSPWREVSRCDPFAVALADRHYSRQTVGAAQFTPPGRTLVMTTDDGLAAWAVVENFDGSGDDGRRWRCTLFRNEGPTLSSDLVRSATAMTFAYWRMTWGGWGRRLITEVDTTKTRKKRDPGRCFRRAGWTVIGETTRGLILLAAPDSSTSNAKLSEG